MLRRDCCGLCKADQHLTAEFGRWRPLTHSFNQKINFSRLHDASNACRTPAPRPPTDGWRHRQQWDSLTLPEVASRSKFGGNYECSMKMALEAHARPTRKKWSKQAPKADDRLAGRFISRGKLTGPSARARWHPAPIENPQERTADDGGGGQCSRRVRGATWKDGNAGNEPARLVAVHQQRLGDGTAGSGRRDGDGDPRNHARWVPPCFCYCSFSFTLRSWRVSDYKGRAPLSSTFSLCDAFYAALAAAVLPRSFVHTAVSTRWSWCAAPKSRFIMNECGSNFLRMGSATQKGYTLQ